MKLLSVNLARSIWFCNFIDLNPRGISLLQIIPRIVERYKFKKFPLPNEIADLGKGVKFEEGEFKNRDGDLIYLTFVAYSDGLMVDTRSSTRDSDDFLSEILTSLSIDFKLPHYEEVLRKKTYISQLYMTTDKSIELMNPKLKKISQYLSENISHPYEAAAITFWPDQTSKLNLPLFTFERVLNIPFSENRYYSTCGLQTDRHLELLNELEDILSGS